MPIKENTVVKSKVRRVPNGWSSIRVGETTSSFGGSTPSTSEATYWDNGDILWATPTDITNLDSKFISDTSRKITETAIDNTSLKLFPSGTILMTSRATIGYPAIAKKPITTNQGFINIECGNQIHNLFLYYWIIQKKKLFERFAQGSTFIELSKKDFRKFYISLPPYKEQNKIAEILSTVDDAVENSDAIIKETQQLKKGLMEKLFTEGIGHKRFKETNIGRIPEKWKTIKLKDVIKLSSGKARPKDFTPSYCKNKIYPIYGGNGIMGYSSEFNFEINTIILGRVGEYCGAVHRNNGKCWISDNALYIKEFIDDSFDLLFLALSLGYKNLNKYKSRSGQPLISQSVLYPLHLALPPIEEQKKISANILEIDKKLENEQSYKSELEQLKKGLMQVLLIGKVRVKV